MKLYHHPASLQRSSEFSVRINGCPVEVLFTGVADFVICALGPEDLPATVEVTSSRPVASARVRPLTKKIETTLADGSVRFLLAGPEKLSVEIEGCKALYLFANPPEINPPAPGDPGVVTFSAGRIHEVPVLTMTEGHTLYLPGGAVLKGRIHIKGRAGIRICGHGVFDGSFYDREAGEAFPSIILERCPDVVVEEITMVRPQGWMIMLAACAGATVRNVKQIGEVVCSDGVDVVGSSNVLIEDSFFHNNDDCVVVKAHFFGEKRDSASLKVNARENVENVMVRRCTLANWKAGNAMEIGHELSVDRIRDITFTDIDILHVHGDGAVFSIHNCDRALVENIRFENIRIDHCYAKLIDFRIFRSRYSTDAERGQIRGVVLRDIQWTRTPFNAGYTVSVIGGSDAAHTVEDVAIENFVIDGVSVRHLDELEICTRHCHNLRLQSPQTPVGAGGGNDGADFLKHQVERE